MILIILNNYYLAMLFVCNVILIWRDQFLDFKGPMCFTIHIVIIRNVTWTQLTIKKKQKFVQLERESSVWMTMSGKMEAASYSSFKTESEVSHSVTTTTGWFRYTFSVLSILVVFEGKYILGTWLLINFKMINNFKSLMKNIEKRQKSNILPFRNYQIQHLELFTLAILNR